MEFAELNKLDFFTVESDCGIVTGKADLMKLNGLESICISSSNGTYIKGVVYAMQCKQKVIRTC